MFSENDEDFLESLMESLLVKVGVWSLQTWMTAQKGHHIWSDRWITLKVLQEFPEAVLLVVPMESLLVEAEV
jgi:hypothetical protein